MNEQPKCPYCGTEMQMAMSHTFYRCTRCGSTSPEINDLHTAAVTPEEVVTAAALRRYTPTVGRWINPEEAQPEFGRKVLVQNAAGAISVAARSDKFDRPDIFMDDGGMYAQQITAWMPLPEPYQPKGAQK